MLFHSYLFKKTAKLCQNEIFQFKASCRYPRLGLKWYKFWEGTSIIQLQNYSKTFIQHFFLNPPDFRLQFSPIIFKKDHKLVYKISKKKYKYITVCYLKIKTEHTAIFQTRFIIFNYK